MTPRPRLRVGVAGVGRAGSVLGAAFTRAGHDVVAAHAVSDRSRALARTLLPGVPLVTIETVFAAADLVLLTVPDDALPALVRSAADADWIRPGCFLVHTSGRYGAAVLDPATRRGALPLALHPVMTLTGSAEDVERLVGCPFGVTAPPQLLPVASALVVDLGGEPMPVAEDQRPLYHAALAHGANHLVTVVNDALAMLAAAGIAEPARLLEPLLTAALDNTVRLGDAALTGPVARGDAGTVAAHLTTLTGLDPALAAVYRALARRTADRALAAGRLDAAAAEPLLAVLAEP